MGVAWVFETKESPRSVELSFEQAGAILKGTPKSFKVDCTWYRPPVNISGQISSFYLLHHSNFPDSSFIIGASTYADGNATPRLQSKATADQGFDLILTKFNAGLIAENTQKFELTGNEYYLKDFRLRVGTVGLASVVKGVIVEIEYAPCNVLFQCEKLLKEIIETFFPGQSRYKPEIFLRNNYSDIWNYMGIDTLTQYLDIFLAMRKKA